MSLQHTNNQAILIWDIRIHTTLDPQISPLGASLDFCILSYSKDGAYKAFQEVSYILGITFYLILYFFHATFSSNGILFYVY